MYGRSLPVLPPPIPAPPHPKKSHLSNLSFSARTLGESLDDSLQVHQDLLVNFKCILQAFGIA